MKPLFIIFSLFTIISSQADFWGTPVKASLTCIGEETSSGALIEIDIISNESGTRLIFDRNREITNTTLTAGSEGTIYIQQVLNNNYNLAIAGKDLDDLFNSEDKLNEKVSIDGFITTWFEDGEKSYELVCDGVLGINQW